MNFTTWSRTYSDTIEIPTAELPMMNSQTSVSNNISEKWPSKDFTERKVTTKDGTREK